MFANPQTLCCWAALGLAFAALPGAAAQDLQSRVQAAEQQFSQGHYPEAEEDLSFVLGRLPRDFNANELMGLVCSAEGKEARATGYLARAVQTNPTSIVARENLAANYARLGKSALAETQLLRLAELDSRNFAVLHNLGEFYVQQGKIATAVPWLRKAQQLDPSNYRNGYDLCLGLIQTGHLAEAETQLQSLIRIRDTAELHSLLADAYERDGKLLPAGSEYQRAAQMAPTEATVFDWGAELLRHRNLPEAEQVFSRGCSIFPQSTRMVIGLGLAEHLAGNEEQAVRAILKAVDLDPADKRSYYFLSTMNRVPPDLRKEVAQRFERYAERFPQRADAQYYYAASQWSANEMSGSFQSDAAIELRLKRALALDPGLYDAHNLLGVICQNDGQYKQAAHEFAVAIQQKPTLEDAHYHLALLLYRLGQKQRGDAEMQQFRKLRASEKEDIVVTFLVSNQKTAE